MKIENQVCSLEQAKKLKDLGVCQDSFFSWYGGFNGSEMPPSVDLTDQRNYEYSVNGNYGHPDHMYAAFNVAELGTMLPEYVETYFTRHGSEGGPRCVYVSLVKKFEHKNNKTTVHHSLHVTGLDQNDEVDGKMPQNLEASSRADMLIWCIENKIISAQQCNDLLKADGDE